MEVQNRPATGATEPDDICFASFGQLHARDAHPTILPPIAGYECATRERGVVR